MECFDLAHGKDKFWDFVNKVMNCQCSINCGEYLELLRNYQPQKKELSNEVSSCFKFFSDVVLTPTMSNSDFLIT